MSELTCTIPGCGNKHAAKGWCANHYYRAKRHDGDPLGGNSTPAGDARAYLYANIALGGEACRLWPYASTRGYGQVNLTKGGGMRYPHILACAYWWGPRPESGMQVAHGRLSRCVSTLCWNGEHLSWKSPADNNADKFRDGTLLFGERTPAAKLTTEAVRAIRSAATAGVAHPVIAATHGVSRSNISMIVSRKTWRHVQ